MNIYEGDGVMVVGPYTWEPWEDIDMWVTLPDPIYRKVSVDDTYLLLYLTEQLTQADGTWENVTKRKNKD